MSSEEESIDVVSDELTAIFIDEDDVEIVIEETVTVTETSLLDLDEVDKENVITDFVQRRRQQFTPKSRTKKQYVFLVFLAVLVVVTLIVLVLESPLYDIDKVEVKNVSASQLSDAEITQINKITSGIKGQQTYRLKVNGIEDKLQDLNYIKSVDISKKWPSNVTVTLNRRVPVAVIETDQGYVSVDQDGIVFEKTGAPDKSLPILDGIAQVTYSKAIPNEDFMKIINAVPDSMKGQISRISLKDKDYTATLTDGITVKLGNDNEMKQKLTIAWSIIMTKGRKDIGYIDVSVPSLPVSGSPQLANESSK